MARTISKDVTEIEEKVCTYRKIGGGAFRLTNPDRIIKPNQVFKAKPSEIPDAFRGLVQCLEPDKEKDIIKEEVVSLTPAKFVLLPAAADGKFWVVNEATQKKMNVIPWNEDKATELMKSLNK